MKVVFVANKKRHVIECETIQQASKIFRDFIEEFDLGSSDCLEAYIKNARSYFARISYNGRVWEFNGTIHSFDTDKLLYCPYA